MGGTTFLNNQTTCMHPRVFFEGVVMILEC